MTESSTAQAAGEDRLDLVFKALADQTRRAQLRRLARGPATVSELAEPFSMSLPAASKHLRVLERAGLVSRTKSGRIHHCRIHPEALLEVDNWLVYYRRFWSDTLDALAQFAAGDSD